MNPILTALFLSTSMHFHLPAGLLDSICLVESGHNTSAMHFADGEGNSVGICQIKFKTAKWLGFKGTEKELMRPDINIYYAGKYLARNIKRYNGSTTKAVIAYNMGHVGALTTTKYSARVFKTWGTYTNDRQPATVSVQER